MAKPKKGKNKVSKPDPPAKPGPPPKTEVKVEVKHAPVEERVKHRAKVETEDEEEIPPLNDAVLPLFPSDFPQAEELFEPIGPSNPPGNITWGLAPDDSVSNVNSNTGAWGGAARSPPPKRTSININNDHYLMNDAAASALTARIQDLQQQQEMFGQQPHQRDVQQYGKEHRGRQKGRHGREAADNANDSAWGATAATGGGWGAADQGNSWQQPPGNVDDWGVPSLAPGGFGAGPSPGGLAAHNATPRVGRSVFSDHDYEDERGTAVNEHGMGGWGENIVQQRAQASGGGGDRGWGAAGGWGDATGGTWGNLPGGGWGATGGGQQATTDNWGMPAKATPKAHAPSLANTSSWGGWGTTPQHQHQQHAHSGLANAKIPKVTVQAPSSVDAKTVVSAKQHSGGGFLSTLLGFGRKNHQGNTIKNGKEQKEKSKQNDKGNPRKTGEATAKYSPWVHVQPDIEEEEDEDYDEDEDDYEEEDEEDDYYDDNAYNAWPGQTHQGWPDPNLGRHSKVYSNANMHTPASWHRTELPQTGGLSMDTHGIGLEPAKKALFSKDRLARDRIHWLFDPRKDPRVATVLDIVDRSGVELAKLGLDKLIQTKERGALFINVDCHHPAIHYLPTFDFLSYNEVKDTYDRTLQESLAYYDPMGQVLVFVFLLSKSKNSMAIWRRKIPVPADLKAAYGPTLVSLITTLNEKYPIYLDEPIDPDAEAKKKLTKKKWLRWGR